MSKSMLLPNKFKTLGWIILVPGVIAGVLLLVSNPNPIFDFPVFSIFNEDADNGFSGIVKNNIADELVSVCLIIGGLLVAFSQEKYEDEGIQRLRTNSLIWAVIVNYLILLLGVVVTHEFAFLKVMIYNMFTVLLIFILKFHLTKFLKTLPNLK